MLIESNAKSLEERSGCAPEKLEKKAGGKKSIYTHSCNKMKKFMKLSNNNRFIIFIRIETNNITI